MLEFKSWLLLLEGADDEVESIKNRTNPLFNKALGVSHDWVGETLKQAYNMNYMGGDALPVANGAIASLLHRLDDIKWGTDPIKVFRRAIRFDISHIGEKEFGTRRPHRDVPLSTLSNGDKPKDFAAPMPPPDADLTYQSYQDALLKQLGEKLKNAKDNNQLRKIQRADLALKIAKIQTDSPYDRVGLDQLVTMFPDVARTTLYNVTLDIQDTAKSIIPDSF